MNLGESFPQDAKTDFVERNLKPSFVVKLFCNSTNPPKEKRLVIISLNPNFLLFVINSQIPKFKEHRPHLKCQQISLKVENEEFLDYDSWLDCSEVFREFELEEVKEIIMEDTSRVLGKLSNEVIAQIMDVVTESETLERRHINQIISDIS